jgi:hypothetical protein
MAATGITLSGPITFEAGSIVINYTLPDFSPVLAAIAALESKLTSYKGEVMALMDDLETEVGKLTTVVDSSNAFIKLVHDELVAARGDPARVQSVIDTLAHKREEISSAIVANTDAPDTPPSPPPAP